MSGKRRNSYRVPGGDNPVPRYAHGMSGNSRRHADRLPRGDDALPTDANAMPWANGWPGDRLPGRRDAVPGADNDLPATATGNHLQSEHLGESASTGHRHDGGRQWPDKALARDDIAGIDDGRIVASFSGGALPCDRCELPAARRCNSVI